MKRIKYKGFIIEKDTDFGAMNDCRIKSLDGKILITGLRTIRNAKLRITETPEWLKEDE